MVGIFNIFVALVRHYELIKWNKPNCHYITFYDKFCLRLNNNSHAKVLFEDMLFYVPNYFRHILREQITNTNVTKYWSCQRKCCYLWKKLPGVFYANLSFFYPVILSMQLTQINFKRASTIIVILYHVSTKLYV